MVASRPAHVGMVESTLSSVRRVGAVVGTDDPTSKPDHMGPTPPGVQGLLCLPSWPARSVGSEKGGMGLGD